MIARVLSVRGHSVVALECAEALDEVNLVLQTDLFIIDINLPGEDGFSLTSRIRQIYPGAGIIMATARTESADRVHGYETGADIYLTKPFELSELIAVVKAVSRRCVKPLLQNDNSTELLRLNRLSYQLEGHKGSTTNLSADEAAILDGLARAPAFQLETWQIMEMIGLELDEKGKRNLEVRIVRLRKKIAQVGFQGEGIKAIRSKGYRLIAPLRIE